MVQTLPSVTSLFLPPDVVGVMSKTPVSVPGKGQHTNSPSFSPRRHNRVQSPEPAVDGRFLRCCHSDMGSAKEDVLDLLCLQRVLQVHHLLHNPGWSWQGKDRRNTSRGGSTHVFAAKHRTKSSPRGWSFAVYFCLENLLMLRCKADPK